MRSRQPMPLGPGARLGSYEIVSAIGAGGVALDELENERVFFDSVDRADVWISDARSCASRAKDLAPVNVPYHTYAVSADGQRFLIPVPSSTTTGTTFPIAVVENWAAGLTK